MPRNNTDIWLQKELELNQRHEELLLRREILLRGTETYYDTQIDRSASFIADAKKAKVRNEQLYQDWKSCLQDIRENTRDPTTPRFKTLQNNYWTMVKNVFPVYLEELKEYNRRHSFPTPKRSTSPKLPNTPLTGTQLTTPGGTLRSTQGSLRSQQGSTTRSLQGSLKSLGASGQPQGILKSPGSTIRSGTGTLKSTSFKT